MLRRVAASTLASLVAVMTVCASVRASTPATQVIAAARIVSIAERIARSIVTDPNRALAPASQIADQSVPAGDVVIAPGVPQVNATYVSVPIAIDVDGKLARTVFAGYRITAYIHTAVAAHDLPPGAILTADDLTLARVPYEGRPAIGVEMLLGRKLRAGLANGAVLYPELTVVNELVRAGTPVQFIVHDGPVALAADVVARTGGGLGDSVMIFNPQTQKALSGVVTGPNVVELTLPGAH